MRRFRSPTECTTAAVLTCLEHLWQFDLRTGEPRGDAEAPMETYKLKQENGALYVWVEPAG